MTDHTPAPTQVAQADETLAGLLERLLTEEYGDEDWAALGSLRRISNALAAHVATIRAEREDGLVIPAAAKLKAGDMVRYLGLGSWELVEPECPTPGCSGDPNYPAPGRSHNADCTYPDIPADAEQAAARALVERVQVLADDYRPRCPVHNIPDCSVLLNGCTRPQEMHRAVTDFAKAALGGGE